MKTAAQASGCIVDLSRSRNRKSCQALTGCRTIQINTPACPKDTLTKMGPTSWGRRSGAGQAGAARHHDGLVHAGRIVPGGAQAACPLPPHPRLRSSWRGSIPYPCLPRIRSPVRSARPYTGSALPRHTDRYGRRIGKDTWRQPAGVIRQKVQCDSLEVFIDWNFLQCCSRLRAVCFQ